LFERTPERRILAKKDGDEEKESPNYFEERARANMLTKSLDKNLIKMRDGKRCIV
jgi:hypothetical protein